MASAQPPLHRGPARLASSVPAGPHVPATKPASAEPTMIKTDTQPEGSTHTRHSSPTLHVSIISCLSRCPITHRGTRDLQSCSSICLLCSTADIQAMLRTARMIRCTAACRAQPSRRTVPLLTPDFLLRQAAILLQRTALQAASTSCATHCPCLGWHRSAERQPQGHMARAAQPSSAHNHTQPCWLPDSSDCVQPCSHAAGRCVYQQ
jgi:hypothetical protein